MKRRNAITGVAALAAGALAMVSGKAKASHASELSGAGIIVYLFTAWPSDITRYGAIVQIGYDEKDGEPLWSLHTQEKPREAFSCIVSQTKDLSHLGRLWVARCRGCSNGLKTAKAVANHVRHSMSRFWAEEADRDKWGHLITKVPPTSKMMANIYCRRCGLGKGKGFTAKQAWGRSCKGYA